jgi:hypothetical protein
MPRWFQTGLFVILGEGVQLGDGQEEVNVRDERRAASSRGCLREWRDALKVVERHCPVYATDR